eukprot:CAMPEP_0116875000 /NCGR_PEP_ID=MMETSP0463-20121206/6690_1 /TAXON_ID=181622 /ORGANISM="Strombidinopsis sp, Strain SopsisLIS2011" /LENGTH=57 /DNA_ID=CAMNT_0004519663 /DNA_START=609 /DNA_END=782 /DNA_ORIENTATION=+
MKLNLKKNAASNKLSGDNQSQSVANAEIDNSMKIVKLAYGKDGLILFLEHLFGLFDE